MATGSRDSILKWGLRQEWPTKLPEIELRLIVAKHSDVALQLHPPLKEVDMESFCGRFRVKFESMFAIDSKSTGNRLKNDSKSTPLEGVGGRGG